MKLILKPERGFGKVEVEVPEETWIEITRLSENYGVPVERIIQLALVGEFKKPRGELEELKRKVEELKRRVWRLESEYAPLRFKAYGLSEDNKILAREVSSLLAENAGLRRFLKLPLRRDPELRKLISYYMR
jgi:predicted RNase H-like nuclease (RuvC/YqgF family)